MDKKKKNKRDNQYKKEHCRRYSVMFFNTTDKDIINKLDSEPNKIGYLKRIIREDISRRK